MILSQTSNFHIFHTCYRSGYGDCATHPCVGIGIGFKSIVKLNICAQPMHKIFIIEYCILLKTSLSE